MKMNGLEKFVMNSPIRSFILRRYEAPLLQCVGGSLEGLEVLEVGCGRGVSTQLILEQFRARRVTAIDLDPDQIGRAKRRLSAYPPDRCQVQVGDATALALPDASVDPVVDFAALHHVPQWQEAVREIARVLKPGGRFLFEEVTKRWLEKWFARTFFVHPTESRFTTAQFLAELARYGIAVGDNFVERSGGDYVFGAGRRSDVLVSSPRPEQVPQLLTS